MNLQGQIHVRLAGTKTATSSSSPPDVAMMLPEKAKSVRDGWMIAAAGDNAQFVRCGMSRLRELVPVLGMVERTDQLLAAKTSGAMKLESHEIFWLRRFRNKVEHLDVQPRPTIHETRYAVELLDRFLASLTAADIQYLATLR